MAASDLPADRVPAKFIVEGDHLEMVPEGAPLVAVAVLDLWNKICADGGEALMDPAKNDLLLSFLDRWGQLFATRCGWQALLDTLTRPNAADEVPDAADSMVKNWRIIKSIVPGALTGFTLDTFIDLLRRLKFIRGARELVKKLDDRLLAVQTQLEVGLDRPMRAIYGRGEALIETHEDLAGPLAPVTHYIKGAAFRALDRRRDNDRVRDKAAEVTRDKAEAPVAPAAPQTPPIVVVTPAPAAIAAPPAAPAPKPGRSRS